MTKPESLKEKLDRWKKMEVSPQGNLPQEPEVMEETTYKKIWERIKYIQNEVARIYGFNHRHLPKK